MSTLVAIWDLQMGRRPLTLSESITLGSIPQCLYWVTIPAALSWNELLMPCCDKSMLQGVDLHLLSGIDWRVYGVAPWFCSLLLQSGDWALMLGQCPSTFQNWGGGGEVMQLQRSRRCSTLECCVALAVIYDVLSFLSRWLTDWGSWWKMIDCMTDEIFLDLLIDDSDGCLSDRLTNRLLLPADCWCCPRICCCCCWLAIILALEPLTDTTDCCYRLIDWLASNWLTDNICNLLS